MSWMSFKKHIISKLVWKKKQWLTIVEQLLHPYAYKPERYANTFLAKTSDSDDASITKPVPRVVYVFWTGDNEMSENRKRCLSIINSKIGVEVRLITPRNLKDYVLPNYPLHPAYEYLSYVHRSDYLRCYFMNYYGGGYGDVKSISHSWISMFDRLDASDAYIIGYSERKFDDAAWYGEQDENLRNDMYTYWRVLLGNGGYICRPHTKFTEEWYEEICRRLDAHIEELKQHPSQEDPYANEGTDYPIKWTEICGSVFHPLCLKYSERVLRNDKLRPSGKNYR